MSREDLIKLIDGIDLELEKNKRFGAYIPTTRLLMDYREMLVDMLYRLYGIFYI